MLSKNQQSLHWLGSNHTRMPWRLWQTRTLIWSRSMISTFMSRAVLSPKTDLVLVIMSWRLKCIKIYLTYFFFVYRCHFGQLACIVVFWLPCPSYHGNDWRNFAKRSSVACGRHQRKGCISSSCRHPQDHLAIPQSQGCRARCSREAERWHWICVCKEHLGRLGSGSRHEWEREMDHARIWKPFVIKMSS